MAGIVGTVGKVGVYGFAAIGLSQTVWFGVKAYQGHDPGAEQRSKAAGKRAAFAAAAAGSAAAPSCRAGTAVASAQLSSAATADRSVCCRAVEDGAMVTASLEVRAPPPLLLRRCASAAELSWCTGRSTWAATCGA